MTSRARHVAASLVAAITLQLAIGGLVTMRPVIASACPLSDYVASLHAMREALSTTPPRVEAARATIQETIRATPSVGPALQALLDDLSGASPDSADARRRLDAMIATLDSPGRSSCPADVHGARDTLDQVYRSPVFDNLGKNTRSGFFSAVGDALGRVLSRIFNGLGPAGSGLVVAIVVLVLLILAFLRIRGMSAGRRVISPADSAIQETNDPETEWSAATAAAARGAYPEAIRRAFRSALLTVAQRGRLRVDAAATNRELLTRASGDADLMALLAPAAATFERAWYSGHGASQSDWNEARARCAAIRTLATQRAEVPVS